MREQLFRNTYFGFLLDIDDSLENYVLIHFMSCRQIESFPEHTDAVPFTYHLNGHYLKFRREEFCLITGLRFGPENSDHYVEDKINGEEFSKLQDEDVVAICQLAVLHLLRYANSSRWDRFYACQALLNRPLAKYTLSSFTWAFKVCSRDFFDGRIFEAPPILPPINQTSRFDVPKNIDQRFDEQQQIIKELQKKNEAQDRLLNEVYNFYKASDSFYDVGQTTPIYSATFEQPMPSRYPTSYPGTPHIATPMAQQGFSPWSYTPYQADPSHVGGVNPLSSFTCLPETTVAPKKRANNIRSMTRNAIVSPFNLRKAGIDLNSQVEELMYLGSRATDDYISLHNVDHTKQINYWMELMIRARPVGARYTMAKTETSSLLETPDIVYMPINTGGNHWVTGILNLGASTIHIIDSLEWTGRIPSSIDHILIWTNVLNVLLEKAGHFKEQDDDHTLLSYYTIEV
uniref:Phospholipase-like protein n=1 Tax=Tanacetum cinerariifolium TaxID=118510 RepID=A0A6L2P2K0_TANCI|nr:phospholipase-like protein [Tanacetum cinerariifolium]